MKKFFNRALIYQSFYIGKWAILAGVLSLAFLVQVTVSGAFNSTMYFISSLQGNTFYSDSFTITIVVCLFLLLTYVMITGFNKRNNIVFLTSGPYSKEEIKRNEFLFLFGALVIFTLIISYIFTCCIISNSYLLPFVNDVWGTMFFTIIKVITVGVAFISYLAIFDMLFSNLLISVIALVGVPAAIILNLSIIIRVVFQYTGMDDGIARAIYEILRGLVRFIENILRFISSEYSYIESKVESNVAVIAIITLILGAVILYFIRVLITKKMTINNISKFFTFKIVGRLSADMLVFTFCSILMLFFLNSNDMNISRQFIGISNTTYILITTAFFIGFIFLSDFIGKKFINRFYKYI